MIATGHTDDLIKTIVDESDSLHSVSQLLSIGVRSVPQAEAILLIIHSVY